MPPRRPLPAFTAILTGQCGDLPVAGYLRRSDEDQSAYSPEAQERIVRSACANWGLREPVIYLDDDVSGGRWQRPAFDRLRRDVQAGKIRIVVVPKIDRFARDVILCLQTVDAFHAAGAAVVSVFEPLDFSSPFGRKALTDAASNAEWYRRNLATEVSKGLSAKAASGKALGLVSYGYRRLHEMNPRTGERVKGTDRLEPTEDAPVVVRVYALYTTEQHSDTTIAALLNEEGITHLDPQTGERRAWRRDTVRKILTNPIYAGWVVYRGERYEGTHPPLVSRDLWERCQEIRAKRSRTRVGTVISRSEGGIFSTVARCGACRDTMHAWLVGSQRSRSYFCKRRRTQGKAACDAQMTPESVALAALDRILSMLVLPDSVIASVVQQAAAPLPPPPPPPDSRKADLAALKLQFLADELSAAEYEERRRAIEQQHVEPPPRPRARRLNPSAAIKRLRELPALFAAGGHGRKQALIRELFSVVYLRRDVGIAAVTPTADYLPLIRAIAAWRAEFAAATPSGNEVAAANFPDIWEPIE